MSSDGSSTLSKIREFGLYKSVDLRTEEFLKLSRRKQIKQGCAYAAVSTAVTVTIVILLTTLRFYASGCYQQPIGLQWGCSMSQKSVSRVIRRVTFAINKYLLRKHIKFPMTEGDRKMAKLKFRNAAQPFPGAIGAIDCTHIKILAPRIHEEAYVSGHHEGHSLNVQAVILLIYEYAIAVESNQVQTNRYFTNNSNVNITEDHPIADRLDRSYFGFDQEAFERMPLLVNAMQENSYVDPSIELPMPENHKKAKLLNLNQKNDHTFDSRYKPIRRTSPRPFIFEYRSPTPTPFTNTHNYNSRNWVESYRNAQRLKNMEQVLKYLEKTINAKFADLYTLPSTHIAFSGLYVPPNADVKAPIKSTTTTTSAPDQTAQASRDNNAVFRKPNYSADPLFTYKPESPGDVNLLADQSLRFSPSPIQNIQKINREEEKRVFKIPMFRPIPKFRHGCLGTRCGLQHGLDKKILQVLQGSTESERIIEKPKSFSVMLNLFPMQQKRQDVFPHTHSIFDKVYFTTTRPKLQFKPKLTTIKSRPSYIRRQKRPRILAENKSFTTTKSIESSSEKIPAGLEFSSEPTNVLFHVNVFPKNTVTLPKITTHIPSTTTDIETTSFEILKNNVLTTIPPKRSVEIMKSVSENSVTITPNALPTVTTTYPFYETDSKHFKVWPTNRPEILKFSHEDAKIPDQYLQFGDRYPTTTEPVSIRRVSTELINSNDEVKEDQSPSNEDMKELIYKLKNKLETTTNVEEIVTETDGIETTENPTTTTAQTYVPQINGHYRSLNQNSRNINNWLNGESDKKQSRRLEITSLTVTRKPYVEIQRKSSKNFEEESDIVE